MHTVCLFTILVQNTTITILNKMLKFAVTKEKPQGEEEDAGIEMNP